MHVLIFNLSQLWSSELRAYNILAHLWYPIMQLLISLILVRLISPILELLLDLFQKLPIRIVDEQINGIEWEVLLSVFLKVRTETRPLLVITTVSRQPGWWTSHPLLDFEWAVWQEQAWRQCIDEQWVLDTWECLGQEENGCWVWVDLRIWGGRSNGPMYCWQIRVVDEWIGQCLRQWHDMQIEDVFTVE